MVQQAQGTRHPGGETRPSFSAKFPFADAQGIQHPVGHRWGLEASCGTVGWARKGKKTRPNQGEKNQGQRRRHNAVATTEACMTAVSAPKIRAMPTCITCIDAVIGLHTLGSVGRQVADDQDNMGRGAAIGSHTHGNAARRVVDDLDTEWSATPVRQPLGLANAETTPPVTQTVAAVTMQQLTREEGVIVLDRVVGL